MAGSKLRVGLYLIININVCKMIPHLSQILLADHSESASQPFVPDRDIRQLFGVSDQRSST